MSAVVNDGQLYELLARAGHKQVLAPGSLIFSTGDEARSMFIFLSGTVDLLKGDELLRRVDAPSMVGEMALIDYAPRSLTAVAVTEVEIVEIPERTFWVLVHETPKFAQLVMRVMTERVRSLSGTD